MPGQREAYYRLLDYLPRELQDRVRSLFQAVVFQDEVEIRSGTITPDTVPARVGQLYVNTSTKKVYVASGTSATSDWTLVN